MVVNRLVAETIRTMEADSLAAVQAELERMNKLNNAWPMYVAVWLVFGIGGLLRFALNDDFYQGLGIVLSFLQG